MTTGSSKITAGSWALGFGAPGAHARMAPWPCCPCAAPAHSNLAQPARCTHDDRRVPQAAPAARPPLAGLEVPQLAAGGAADVLRRAGKAIRGSLGLPPRWGQLPPPLPPTVVQPPLSRSTLRRFSHHAFDAVQALVMFSYYRRIAASKACAGGWLQLLLGLANCSAMVSQPGRFMPPVPAADLIRACRLLH